jgi:hypothetical protein
MRGWKRFDEAPIQCMDCGKVIGHSVAYNSICVDFNYHMSQCNNMFQEQYLRKVDRNVRKGRKADRLMLEVTQVLCTDCHTILKQARDNRLNVRL